MSQQADEGSSVVEEVSGGVLIIDFGAQYCQLIARRIRELGVYSRITVPERAMFTLKHMRPKAIILSGGPCSVYSDDAPSLDPAILEQGIPVLGICYGLQWLAQHTGGAVLAAESGAGFVVAQVPTDVDYRVMVTFLTFYTCQLKFINFKLYNDEGYAYPPALEAGRDDGGLGLAAVQVRKVGAAAAPALEDVRHTRLLLPCAEPGR